jgi:hypothetical protein
VVVGSSPTVGACFLLPNFLSRYSLWAFLSSLQERRAIDRSVSVKDKEVL